MANRITRQAYLHPHKKALLLPRKRLGRLGGDYFYEHLTFAQLEKRINHMAHKLAQWGVGKGVKVLVLVRPSFEFPAIIFALFRVGAIPVFIDPGMKRSDLLASIRQVAPSVLIAEPIVHLFRFVYRKAFQSVTMAMVPSERRPFCFYGVNRRDDADHFSAEVMGREDTAAILFTSGGTGVPKGVVYTHEIFSKQTDILQDIFSLTENDIDVSAFPLFSLFTLSMGVTCCIPDINASRPAEASPENLVTHIRDLKATFATGSPAIWKRVAECCQSRGLSLPSLRSLVMFGAPVPVALHKAFREILPHGTTYTPYGATESLPVSNISGREVLAQTGQLTHRGKGTCLGRPIPQMEVKIIDITEAPLKYWDEAHVLPMGIVGEIVVSGPVATKSYYRMPEKTAQAKIRGERRGERGGEREKKIWHRMGDLGYFDSKGRLWFCGRKAHMVETSSRERLYTASCEPIFNNHPQVDKAALIGIDLGTKSQAQRQRPAIVVERKDKRLLRGASRKRFEEELLDLSSRFPHTKGIRTFFYRKHLPVDARHNIKIDRSRLRDEITRELS